MFHWQYLDSRIVYTVVVSMCAGIAASKGLRLRDLVYANPGLPYGGMQIGSKFEVLEKFKSRQEFLDQALIYTHDSLSHRRKAAETFLERIDYPIIAKPDYGCIGIGVRKIDSWQELESVISTMPVDYILQAYTEKAFEFGLFYIRMPWEAEGKVASLSGKHIPFVIGDGRSTARQLMEARPEYAICKTGLYKYSQRLDLIPEEGQRLALLDQASHTYGAIFSDISDRLTPELSQWANRFCSDIDGFYYGRFDIRADSLATAPETGKIIELNGCMSEPIHMYDESYSLQFALKAFFSYYSRAYTIARYNKRQGDTIDAYPSVKDFVRFLNEKKVIQDTIG